MIDEVIDDFGKNGIYHLIYCFVSQTLGSILVKGDRCVCIFLYSWGELDLH